MNFLTELHKRFNPFNFDYASATDKTWLAKVRRGRCFSPCEDESFWGVNKVSRVLTMVRYNL
jgi:hypothetical protein